MKSSPQSVRAEWAKCTERPIFVAVADSNRALIEQQSFVTNAKPEARGCRTLDADRESASRPNLRHGVSNDFVELLK
jgi:hypothetical protein